MSRGLGEGLFSLLAVAAFLVGLVVEKFLTSDPVSVWGWLVIGYYALCLTLIKVCASRLRRDLSDGEDAALKVRLASLEDKVDRLLDRPMTPMVVERSSDAEVALSRVLEMSARMDVLEAISTDVVALRADVAELRKPWWRRAR